MSLLANGEAAPHTPNARASRGPVDHHAAASPGTGGVPVTALKCKVALKGPRQHQSGPVVGTAELPRGASGRSKNGGRQPGAEHGAVGWAWRSMRRPARQLWYAVGEKCVVCVCVCVYDMVSPASWTTHISLLPALLLACFAPLPLRSPPPRPGRLAPPRSDWLKLASSFSPSSRSSCPSPLTAHDDDHPHLHLPRLNLGPRTHCSRSLHQPHTTCDTNLPLSFSSSIPTIHLSFDPPTLPHVQNFPCRLTMYAVLLPS